MSEELRIVTAATMDELADASGKLTEWALSIGASVEFVPMQRHIAVYRITTPQNDDSAPQPEG